MALSKFDNGGLIIRAVAQHGREQQRNGHYQNFGSLILGARREARSVRFTPEDEILSIWS
jgi:hypothetical protein